MKFLPVFVALLSAGLLSGCVWDDDYQPKYDLELHSIIKYPRGKATEKTLTDADGKRIIINEKAFFDSRHFSRAELVPSTDDHRLFDLKIKLNDLGQKLWSQLNIDFRDDAVAVQIGGRYCGKFIPGELPDDDSSWVLFKGPFNEPTAYGIAKYAAKNYRHLGGENFENPFIKYVLNLHKISRRSPQSQEKFLSQTLTAFNGEEVVINAIQILGSKQIRNAEILERPDDPRFYDLALRLNSAGQKLWLQLSVEREPLALMIDGVYYGQITIDKIPEDNAEWVVLKARLNEPTVKGVVNNIKKNFTYFNRSVKNQD